jgi:hypothetical protein
LVTGALLALVTGRLGSAAFARPEARVGAISNRKRNASREFSFTTFLEIFEEPMTASIGAQYF